MYQNYATGQTALVFNLDFTIPQNHLVHAISQFVDSISLAVLEDELSSTGCPAYPPARMLKILLFAYSRMVLFGRKIAQMLTENLPMMYLAASFLFKELVFPDFFFYSLNSRLASAKSPTVAEPLLSIAGKTMYSSSLGT